MNPIDMTFEEKVEQVTKTNRIPSGQGFNFLRFQEIGLHQIVQRTGNVLANAVRSQGLDLEYVAHLLIVSTKVDTFSPTNNQ